MGSIRIFKSQLYSSRPYPMTLVFNDKRVYIALVQYDEGGILVRLRKVIWKEGQFPKLSENEVWLHPDSIIDDSDADFDTYLIISTEDIPSGLHFIAHGINKKLYNEYLDKLAGECVKDLLRSLNF